MQPSECVSRRTFDELEISVVRTARVHWKPQMMGGQDWRPPDVVRDDQDRVIMDVNGLVVRTPDSVMVVDPGPSFGDEENEETSAGSIGFEFLCGLDDALAVLDLKPADVDQVLITHGHGDHYRGVLDGDRPRFANAEHLFPDGDRGRDRRGLLGPLEQAGLLRLVDGDLDLPSDISYVAAPGETPGHHVIRAGSVWYLGDLFHFSDEFVYLDRSPPGRETEQLVSTRRRVLEQADGETIVLTHGRFPAWGAADRAADGWRWRYEQ